LKRKKLYEQQIEKIEGTRMTIETQVLAIEETSVNVEAMRAIREGASTMRNLHQSMYVAFSSLLFAALLLGQMRVLNEQLAY